MRLSPPALEHCTALIVPSASPRQATSALPYEMASPFACKLGELVDNTESLLDHQRDNNDARGFSAANRQMH